MSNPNQLFDTLFREAIGYDPLARFVHHTIDKYPPHDIFRTGDKYKLRLAVAGFAKDELAVKVENGLLTIEGKQSHNEAPEDFQVLHKGIATRDFSRSWQLGEYVEVVDVELSNGLLIVTLERQLPENKKAKTFDIK